MRYLVRTLSILSLIAAQFGAVSSPLLIASGPQAAAAMSQQTQLVVFEAFMRDG
jgi:hypothetical protein